MSDVNCVPWPPLQPDPAFVADVALCDVSVLDWDLRAVMRLFKKSCNAFAVSVVDDAALELDEADVDAVLPETALVLDVDEAVTPSDDNAASMAATKPPPGGGAGCASAADDTPVDVLDSCANSADRLDRLVRELVCPELAIELTLICCS
ncbi:MAG TPA: hypothetical protein VNR70_15330 [Steroidobacteraceae bacterium]|jgi:hypothetical protein|nr:hypothetical protein [Steroidobacteraceae bacterium]